MCQCFLHVHRWDFLPWHVLMILPTGKLGEEENKAHAAKIFPIVTAHLGVPEDRMYILFHEAKTSEVAWKGTTFQAILGK